MTGRARIGVHLAARRTPMPARRRFNATADPMVTLFGIPNCDKVRKARRWLDDHRVAHRFHDFRKDGLDEPRIRAWVAELGWEALLNRSGTTWRAAPDAVKARIDADSAIAFMLQAPAAIKRPVLDTGHARVVGFSESRYRSLFGHN